MGVDEQKDEVALLHHQTCILGVIRALCSSQFCRVDDEDIDIEGRRFNARRRNKAVS